MTFPHARPLLPLLSLLLVVACGGGDGKTSDSGNSETATAGSSGTATAATDTPSTGQPSTGQPSGSGSESASTTSPPDTSTGPEPTGTGTGTTSTSTTSATGDTTDSSSSGGPVCSADGASCAKGELCCQGLDCCAGIPVPPGKEFCSAGCPISDRNLKTEFAAIDPAEVLRQVVDLPLSTWRYRKDEPGVRHLGPMAQDFHATFGLWDRDTMIFPLDASGVSMAAIQGLHARLVAAEAQNEDLRARLDRLERALTSAP